MRYGASQSIEAQDDDRMDRSASCICHQLVERRAFFFRAADPVINVLAASRGARRNRRRP
jgi:hypothetical protein